MSETDKKVAEDQLLKSGERPLRDDEHFVDAAESHSPQQLTDALNELSPTGTNADDEIYQLARQITNMSLRAVKTREGEVINPFVDSQDPELDPNSGHFSPMAWMTHVVNITKRDKDRPPPLTSGVSFRNMGAYGFGTGADYQKTVANILLEVPTIFKRMLGMEKKTKIQILQHFDGLVRCGELCVVLGRPGSGCTTFLKSIACDTHGFYLDDSTLINYQGVPAEDIPKHFRGDFIYNAEIDTHFPHLTVGQTLKFAALARTPRNRILGVSREEYATHMRDVVMAAFGLSHTLNTKVGDDFVRGVSGGERKRVSLAEATLNGSALQCWDNSTRGLDAATALEFIKNLRLSAKIGAMTSFVSLYQASQSAYDLFDKVLVLYEGHQIYFGPTNEAKQFFLDMGFECAARATTGDFLTSLTNPVERKVQPGFESRVPRTPKEFEQRWHESAAYNKLVEDIEAFNQEFPIGGEGLEVFKEARHAKKAKGVSERSPYTIRFGMQVRMCMTRGWQRLLGDLSMAGTTVFGHMIMSLIMSSIFYNMAPTTNSFYQRGALLFFAVLMSAFQSALEILSLYDQRPIVEKHTRYALYHPSAEAMSSMICDLPTKFLTAVSFNLILYFMANLKREAGAFFIFFFFSLVTTMLMSMVFRTIGATSRTISEAMTPASLFILALVIYAGFVIPRNYQLRWAKYWLGYMDPIAYSFESIMVNEFRNRNFTCSNLVPRGGDYNKLSGEFRACAITGYAPPPGQTIIDGSDYVNVAYQYTVGHLWRNLGILFGFMIFFCFTYLYATEKIQALKSKGEILVFKRGHIPVKHLDPEANNGEHPHAQVHVAGTEADDAVANLHKQTGVFQWMDVCYDIPVKGAEKTRRLLDHVDGWVKPGTLTALMGVSGAGKTTLLDTLASRVTMGVVTGQMLVNGRQRNASFQRKTGYVQQQDLHLETSTVREALEFSALLRQPHSVPHEEKLAYVGEVIKILEMEEYADAVVGVPGTGLNVEQRKRLTIGVELAAKPALLLFLDEPTSGLDSQTAWSICSLMRKLADHGQAILCTIHQPSAILFQTFDRLLFLQRGGQTVYFGEIGENSRTLIDYFEREGADPCPDDANPAEWMLEVVGAAPGSVAKREWFDVWTNSPERKRLREGLEDMAAKLAATQDEGDNEHEMMQSFAAPIRTQIIAVTKRVWQQYWRTPSYLWAKIALTTLSPLFIGFSFFKANNDSQGLQNQLFAVFMSMASFGSICQQLMPHFVKQRSLYEVRERPSKTYCWQAFMISNILTELPWQTLCSILQFFVFYYPVGFYRNAEWTNAVHERGALFFLTTWQFYLFTSTFAHMCIAGIDTAETASNIAVIAFNLINLMCGVLATKDQMPGFWKFMYRVSPFTYLVATFMITGLIDAPVTCNPREIVQFRPFNATCGAYMQKFIDKAGGYLENPDATDMCRYCQLNNTNDFLSVFEISTEMKIAWRNFGITWAYIFFNIAGALGLYWLARVPRQPLREYLPSWIRKSHLKERAEKQAAATNAVGGVTEKQQSSPHSSDSDDKSQLPAASMGESGSDSEKRV